MNVIVIGLGSMGRRRIRLLKKTKRDIRVIGVDIDEQRRIQCEDEWGIKTLASIENSCREYNVERAFVCTSPLSHASIITTCLKEKLHVFTEINLVTDGYEENIALAKKNNKILFLSSTFLYREEIKRIKERLRANEHTVNYHYHVGQYLPDWHPWENYKDFFVENKRTNGCREILAIELPWIINTFGIIKSVQVCKGNMSTLEIHYPDNYLIIIEHENGNKGIMAVDIVSRKAVRNLEIIGEAIYIIWDGSPTGLKEYEIESKTTQSIQLYNQVDHLEGYSSFVVENAYEKEIEAFFAAIEEEMQPPYNFIKDMETLKIIDEIER